MEHVDVWQANCWTWATGDTVFISVAHSHSLSIQVYRLASERANSELFGEFAHTFWRLLDIMIHTCNIDTRTKSNYDWFHQHTKWDVCSLFTRNGFSFNFKWNCFRANWSNCSCDNSDSDSSNSSRQQTTTYNYGILHVEKYIKRLLNWMLYKWCWKMVPWECFNLLNRSLFTIRRRQHHRTKALLKNVLLCWGK